MNPRRLFNIISYCLDYSDYCYKCKLYTRGKCNGIRFLLSESLKVIGEVIDNGMANN